MGTALIALATVGFASCGSDANTLAKADGYCDQVAALDATVGSGGSPADGATAAEIADFNKTSNKPVLELLNKIVPVAPKSAVDGAKKLQTEIGKIVDSGDASFINDGFDWVAPLASVQEAAHKGCGYTKVDLTMKDYAYTGVPSTIKAGKVSFWAKNESTKEFHEMAVVAIPNGNTDAPIDLAKKIASRELAATPAASLFAPSSASLGTIVDLKPGKYLYFCSIPVGGQDPSKGLHYDKGMVGTFEVK